MDKEDIKKEPLEFNLKVASDNGNSEQKIIINNDVTNIIRNPNVCAKKREMPNLEFQNIDTVIKNIENNLFVSISSPNIQETGRFYIGKKALECGERIRSIEVGIDNSKVDNDIIIINLLGEIAGYCVKKAYQQNNKFYNNKEIITANVQIATSLPLNQYNKDNNKKFSSKFIGRHIICVYVATECITVEINVTACQIVGEGITTAWALSNLEDSFFDKYNIKYNEKLKQSNIKSKKLLHIAIGEGTTEYPITKDKVFDVNFIKGTPNGVGLAINNALDKFKRDINLPQFSRQAYSKILQNNKDKYYDIAIEDIEEYIIEQAEDIFEIAKNELYKSNNDIDIVLVYGGGSILMRKYLEPKLEDLCEKTKHATLLYIPQNLSVVIEVLGLNNFINNKIFAMLTN